MKGLICVLARARSTGAQAAKRSGNRRERAVVAHEFARQAPPGARSVTARRTGAVLVRVRTGFRWDRPPRTSSDPVGIVANEELGPLFFVQLTARRGKVDQCLEVTLARGAGREQYEH